MNDFWIYLLILAGSTYLVRAIPFAAMRKKIENKFIKSFLYYIPYAVLSAMTLPAAFYATGNSCAVAADCRNSNNTGDVCEVACSNSCLVNSDRCAGFFHSYSGIVCTHLKFLAVVHIFHYITAVCCNELP